MSKPFKKIYHVFSFQDNSNKTDLFAESWKEAVFYYQKLKKQGYKERRLYIDFYNTKEDYENDTNVEEKCIYASDIL